ncbi:hypothetical protein D9758_011715 [Tetrapyrgos nigripes]|uniref:chitinase n=1 Tax=Tetrapyrgos nigripes TaxID=182062 RepID=A0A8H5GDG0_9AGAR|nr:hypothetical protein D9758_011715 [Tetrapyrgos nigripes]
MRNWKFFLAITGTALVFKSAVAIPVTKVLRQDTSHYSREIGTGDVNTSTPAGDQDDSSGTNSSSSSSFKAPYFVLYNDLGPEPAPDPSTIKGWNVLNIAFYLSSGPTDMAQAWKNLDAEKRKSIRQSYQQAGVKLLLSAFGDKDKPIDKDPEQLGQEMADFVIQNDLDGIDVDYEDLDTSTDIAEPWLVTLTKTLRQHLPKEKYLLTHAPQAPWFAEGKLYAQLDKAIGDLIDWYNIQFYNQGQQSYPDCESLFNQADGNTAVYQINKSLQIPLSKLVVGKPGIQSDAHSGYMEPSTLGKCVAQAKGQGWRVMSWQYPHADIKWLQSVKGSTFDGSDPESGPENPGPG